MRSRGEAPLVGVQRVKPFAGSGQSPGSSKKKKFSKGSVGEKISNVGIINFFIIIRNQISTLPYQRESEAFRANPFEQSESKKISKKVILKIGSPFL